MQSIITKILKEMHEFDQFRRKQISRKYGNFLKDAKVKWPYYELKGECNQRIKTVRTLVKSKALKSKDDYFYASRILLNSKRKSNYDLSCKLVKKYHELGGELPLICNELYYNKMDWYKKMTKKQQQKILQNQHLD